MAEYKSFPTDCRQYVTEFLRELTDTQRINIQNNMLISEITINTTPTEIKIGDEALEQRHTVRLFNLSSDYVYWSNDPELTASESTASLLHSGASIIIELNPKQIIKLYAITRARSINLSVTEVS